MSLIKTQMNPSSVFFGSGAWVAENRPLTASIICDRAETRQPLHVHLNDLCTLVLSHGVEAAPISMPFGAAPSAYILIQAMLPMFFVHCYARPLSSASELDLYSLCVLLCRLCAVLHLLLYPC